MVTSWRVRSLLVGLILVGSGCSSSDSGGAEPATQPEQSAKTSDSPGAGEDRRLTDDVEESIDSVAMELSRWRISPPDNIVAPITLAENTLVLSEGVASLAARPGPFMTAPLSDPLDHSKLAERQTGAINTVGAQLSDNWFVWMENPSTDAGVSPWVMFALNRRTGEISELTRAQKMSDGPAISAPGWTGPVLIGDHVFWAQPSGTRRAVRSDVYGCDLRNCEPSPVVKGAAFPAHAGKQLAVVKSPSFEGKNRVRASTAELVDPSSGETTAVIDRFDAQSWPTGLAASRSHVLVTTACKGVEPDVTLYERDGDVVFTQARPGPAGFSYPELSESAAVWAGGNSGAGFAAAGFAYVMDDDRIYKVGNSPGLYDIRVSGNKILWQESIDGDGGQKTTEYVTAQLP